MRKIDNKKKIFILLVTSIVFVVIYLLCFSYTNNKYSDIQTYTYNIEETFLMNNVSTTVNSISIYSLDDEKFLSDLNINEEDLKLYEGNNIAFIKMSFKNNSDKVNYFSIGAFQINKEDFMSCMEPNIFFKLNPILNDQYVVCLRKGSSLDITIPFIVPSKYNDFNLYLSLYPQQISVILN